MPFSQLQNMLINRGYWNAAGDLGTPGGGGGGAESDADTGDSGDNTSDGGDTGADGGDGGDGGADGADDSGTGDEKPASNDDQPRKPTDEEAKLLRDAMKKKARIKELESELDRFKGIDVERYQKLVSEAEAAEQKKLEEKGEWERLRERMKEQAQAQENELKGKVTELQKALEEAHGQINELTVGTQFANSSYINDNLTLTPAKARVVYGSHFEVEDGRVVAYDKPAGAPERTKLIDASGEPLPFESAMKTIVEADPERDLLVKSKVKAGAGSKPNDGKAPPKKVELRGREKITAGLRRSDG